jgi:hypothetical protein
MERPKTIDKLRSEATLARRREAEMNRSLGYEPEYLEGQIGVTVTAKEADEILSYIDFLEKGNLEKGNANKR